MDVPASGTTVVWFRRDLRLDDHPALQWAAERGQVVCLWVADPGLLGRRHHDAPRRLRFLRAGLESLGDDLRGRGVALTIRSGPPERVLPDVCREAGADLVAATREVSPLGRRRDARVAEALAASGAAMRHSRGDLLAEPEDIEGPGGDGYRVFSPFYRAWRELAPPPHAPAPERLEGPLLASDGLDALPGGPSPMPAGAAAARKRLVAFIRDGAADAYDRRRDDVAADATSGLSPYLRFGMCTSAQIGRALGVPGDLSPGRSELWRQIAWREFFHHLLARHPHAARTAWRPEMAAVRWDDDREGFRAWAEGRTGYPLVDAAMRQLAAEGRMHNRTRMVVASFLVKDLLIDWRRGETHFMRHLIDGDPANNNGGWQWVAGTGADAAPYFRIMNPVLQSKRFDPDGAYIRRYVPELARVPAPLVHEPWTMTSDEQAEYGCTLGADYPPPVVDHAERREMVLERYAEARGG
jgi:deoxyribodipyrimidine photo-lyase